MCNKVMILCTRTIENFTGIQEQLRLYAQIFEGDRVSKFVWGDSSGQLFIQVRGSGMSLHALF